MHVGDKADVDPLRGDLIQKGADLDAEALADLIDVAVGGDADIDRVVGDTKAYSPYLTIWLSEFQRIRLQYTYLDAPGNHANQFFLQWTALIGSHVHGFRDR